MSERRLELIDEADDLFAPAVRSRVIDGADRALCVGRQAARRQVFDIDQQQI